MATGHDDVMAAIESTLTALGAFATVTRRAWPQKGRFPCHAALIRAVGEREQQNGGSPTQYDVACTYELTIVVQIEDEVERRRELRRLAALCQNALTAVSLAGITFPTLTTLGVIRYEAKPTHPYERIYLTGSFTYEVGPADRSTDE